MPDVSGDWDAELRSNWPEIKRRMEGETTNGGETPPVKAKIKIMARFFFVRINLDSENHYSSSKTIFVRVARDQEDGGIRLYYIYSNTTLEPAPTDAAQHYGAAYLDVIRGQGRNLWMEGTYWTNRNWHKGLNTAGKVTLRRSAPTQGFWRRLVRSWFGR